MDEEILNRIEDLISKYKELENIDISHESLGTANGFHDAEISKNLTAQFVLQILEDTRKNILEVDDVLVQEALIHNENIFSKLNSIVTEIANLVEKGVHNADYPQKREKLIKQIDDLGKQIKKSNVQLRQELKFANLKKEILDKDEIRKNREELKNYYNEIKSVASESQKILGNLQNRSMSHGVSKSVSDFAVLMSGHKKQEKIWLLIFIVSSVLTVVAFLYALNTEINITDVFSSTVSFIKRLLFIAAPALFMKISLSKYNLERNLRIIYSHRESVLNQYKNFENAIGDDNEAKNEFRLELAKYIFSDPNTGYAGKGSDSGDLNVNPVLNVLDKAAK